MRRRRERLRRNIVIGIGLVLVFFISVGYSLLYTKLTLNSTIQAQTSNSIAKWNVTNNWLDNRIYYYQFVIKIDNKDGPVLDSEKEISFIVPDGLLIDRCNIWVAESKRIVGNRLYMKCYSWATNQQPISLSFQLAFSNQTNMNLTGLAFKNKYLANFMRDTNMKH